MDTPDIRQLTNAEMLQRMGVAAAVRGVDLTVRAGEIFVVMGLSGSGKSTLVRCLSRLVEPTSGRILFCGEDIAEASPDRLREIRRNDLSMIFQHFGLLPHKNVLENVGYGLKLRGTPRQAREKRALAMIRLVGLDGVEDSFPSTLSGGMQQRVGLARALAGDPSMLLLDEPFSALDPLIRRDMQSEIARLRKELGKTMIFITHDLSEALKLGDRIAIMREGRIEQVGSGAELVASPATDYVRDFVRDVKYADFVTLRWIMDCGVGWSGPGPQLSPDMRIADAAPIVLRSGHSVGIVDNGKHVGVVTREAVLNACFRAGSSSSTAF